MTAQGIDIPITQLQNPLCQNPTTMAKTPNPLADIRLALWVKKGHYLDIINPTEMLYYGQTNAHTYDNLHEQIQTTAIFVKPANKKEWKLLGVSWRITLVSERTKTHPPLFKIDFVPHTEPDHGLTRAEKTKANKHRCKYKMNAFLSSGFKWEQMNTGNVSVGITPLKALKV